MEQYLIGKVWNRIFLGKLEKKRNISKSENFSVWWIFIASQTYFFLEGFCRDKRSHRVSSYLWPRCHRRSTSDGYHSQWHPIKQRKWWPLELCIPQGHPGHRGLGFLGFWMWKDIQTTIHQLDGSYVFKELEWVFFRVGLNESAISWYCLGKGGSKSPLKLVPKIPTWHLWRLRTTYCMQYRASYI